MAIYETLTEGGHEHLIDAVKARIAQKADGDVVKSIAMIVKNRPHATIPESYVLSASDAYAAPPMGVSVYGKSGQVTTTGKNLLSNQASDYFTASVDGTNRRVTAIPVEAGESYTYHRASSGYGFYMAWADSLDAPITAYDQVTMSSIGTRTFTNSDNHAYLLVYFSTSYTVANWIPSCEVHEYIVEKGSAFTSYETYSGDKASPRPDWPQEIESVDELGLVVAESNIFDTNFEQTYTAYDLTVTNDGTGTFTVSAPSETSGGRARVFGKDKQIYGTNAYSVNYTIDETHAIRLPAGRYYVWTNNSKVGIIYGNLGTNSHQSVRNTVITSDGDTYYLGCIAVDLSDVADSPLVCQVMVVPADLPTPTAYEPYAGTSTPIDLQGHALRSLPNGTRDELTLTYLGPGTNAGTGLYQASLVQRVGVVTFDGTETWTKALTTPNNMYTRSDATDSKFGDIAIAGSDYNPNNVVVLCDSFGYKGSYSRDNNKRGVVIGGTSTATHLCFDWRDIADSMTTDEWKAWLAENPTTVLYPFDIPIIHDLGTVEMPCLPAPEMTAWADGGSAQPTMGMEYERDAKVVEMSLNSGIASVFSSISEVETSPSTGNHAVGSRIVYDNRLYKVTSAIAAGEDIVPGTNVTATTVAAELLATQA